MNKKKKKHYKRFFFSLAIWQLLLMSKRFSRDQRDGPYDVQAPGEIGGVVGTYNAVGF